MRYLFILLLTGCVTDQKLKGETQHQHNQLKCFGYCEIVQRSVSTTGATRTCKELGDNPT